MPQTPPLDGLPLWAQLAISFIFGVAALGVAYKGYFTKRQPDVQAGDKATAAVLSASIMDAGAVRHLSDVCIRLTGSVDKLTDATEEHTHYLRMQYELDRELCARLRELKELLQRHTP